MLSFILSILFSKLGTLSGPVLCAIAAGAAAWFGFRRIGGALIIVAGVWFALGMSYREGYKQADDKWRAEFVAEQQRQAQAREEIQAQAAAQAAVTATENAELRGKSTDLEAEIAKRDADQAAADLAAANAPPPAAGQPAPACAPVRSCLISPSDAKKLGDIK